MSKSFQERMFQPFEQEMTDQRGLSGSGLGLAVVRSFVQLMDGTIRVESEQGKGSSFSVDIPLGLFEGALYGSGSGRLGTIRERASAGHRR